MPRQQATDEGLPLCVREEHLRIIPEMRAHLCAIHNIAKECLQDFVQRDDDSQVIVLFRKIQAIMDISGKVHG